MGRRWDSPSSRSNGVQVELNKWQTEFEMRFSRVRRLERKGFKEAFSGNVGRLRQEATLVKNTRITAMFC